MELEKIKALLESMNRMARKRIHRPDWREKIILRKERIKWAKANKVMGN